MMEPTDSDFPEALRPPYEAQFYLPSSEFILVGEGKKTERFIFKNQPLTEYEAFKLNKLEAFIREKGMQGFNMPKDYDRSDLLRFLYGCGFVTKKTYNAFIAHLRWRSTFLPSDYRLLIGRLRSLLETGVVYVHGRDNRYRPCLIMDVSRIDLKRHTADDYCTLLCFVLTYIMDVMLLPGKVENWVCISDFAHKGLFGLPTSGIKMILKTCLDNFRCRLAFNYILNAPSSLTFVWMLLKAVLDSRTTAKVTALNANYSERMLGHFAPGQVEQKYGGSAPNMTVFWPPCVPPGPFSAPGDNPHGMLTNYIAPQEPVLAVKADLDESREIERKEEIPDYRLDRLLAKAEKKAVERKIVEKEAYEKTQLEKQAYENEIVEEEGYQSSKQAVEVYQEAQLGEEGYEAKENSLQQLQYEVEVTADDEPFLTSLLRKNRERLKKAGKGVFNPKHAKITEQRPVQLLRVESAIETTTQSTSCYGYPFKCEIY